MENNTKKIYFSKSKVAKGLGVFAAEDIKKNEIIEVCPLILIPQNELEHIGKTKLFYYYFEYSKDKIAIAAGYGSLYNHSYKPNARYDFDYKNKTLKIFSFKEIKKDEEILINYNYYPKDKTPLEKWYKKGVDIQ